ncbi:MAG TPA: hypothetical protein VHH34_14440 [Pseudonocardiaceae bacterium]|nr:hypothetical protein [Pseudonocardiaceae bacterium]
MAMATQVHEVAAQTDDEYWVDDNAAAPVLLVDQAAEAITEALHLVRSGVPLDDQDVTAAGVALGDLFGGLGELADLLSISVCKYSELAPLEVGQIENILETLRNTAHQAKRAAETMQASSAAIQPR